MPIYNRPIEMIKALDSILCQSYSNFELIISNDNSPNPEIDNIVRKYELLDSRIKYYKQNTSLRTVENYQFVLKKASGKYFMWLADDDWLDLYFVENCLNFLENNSDYSICVGNCIYQDNGVVISTNTSRSYTNDSKWVRTISYYHQVSLNGYMYGLIRKSCLDQIEFENEIGFDWEIVGSLFYQGKIKVLNTTAHYITKGGVSNDISSLELPNIACNAPTSLLSDLPTCIFKASIYSPLGISLSSRSLFILDDKNVFLISAI
jgi:glycosyltransferase involved in cell wall biosynthesis